MEVVEKRSRPEDDPTTHQLTSNDPPAHPPQRATDVDHTQDMTGTAQAAPMDEQQPR